MTDHTRRRQNSLFKITPIRAYLLTEILHSSLKILQTLIVKSNFYIPLLVLCIFFSFNSSGVLRIVSFVSGDLLEVYLHG